MDKAGDQVDDDVNSVFSNFNANNRELNSNNDNRDNANDNNVVRLSGSGMNIKQLFLGAVLYVGAFQPSTGHAPDLFQIALCLKYFGFVC